MRRQTPISERLHVELADRVKTEVGQARTLKRLEAARAQPELPVGGVKEAGHVLGVPRIYADAGRRARGRRTGLDRGRSLKAQYPASPGTGGWGFYWAPGTTTSGRAIWSHGGVLAGACNRVDVDPATHTGFVVMTNAPCTTGVGGFINQLEDTEFKALDTL